MEQKLLYQGGALIRMDTVYQLHIVRLPVSCCLTVRFVLDGKLQIFGIRIVNCPGADISGDVKEKLRPIPCRLKLAGLRREGDNWSMSTGQVHVQDPSHTFYYMYLLPSGKRGNGSCNVGWKSELAYIYMYVYMSVTLRNAIITTHVDTSRTGTVRTWLTGDTDKHTKRRLCRLRVQRHRSRADEASRASARTVDHLRRRVIRQQVGRGDVRHSQRLAISREWAAECRTLETAEQRHHSFNWKCKASREAFLRILRMHQFMLTNLLC